MYYKVKHLDQNSTPTIPHFFSLINRNSLKIPKSTDTPRRGGGTAKSHPGYPVFCTGLDEFVKILCVQFKY